MKKKFILIPLLSLTLLLNSIAPALAVFMTDPVPKPLIERGKYATDLFTGSATYSYPISVPKGTNDLTPDVSLAYSSSGVRDFSTYAGSGWQLNHDYVQRDSNYTPSDTSDDKFKLHFKGGVYDLIYNPVDSLFHTKIESHLKIQQFLSGGANTTGMYWQVTTTDGTIYRFGYASNSELLCNGRSYDYTWNLDQVQDLHNNHIYYTYTQSGGTAYLSQIKYNNDQSREIDFSYAANPYQRQVYIQGCNITETSRLSNIQVKAGTTTTTVFSTNDKTSNGNNLTNVGATEVPGLFAGSAKASNFNVAANNRMTAVDNNNLKPTGNFTIEANIKLTSIGAERFIFASWNYDGTKFAGVLFNVEANGTLRIVSAKNTGTTKGTDWEAHYSTTVLSPNVAYHVAGVYDGTKLRLYINGIEEGTGTAWINLPAYQATNYVRIGDAKADIGGEQLSFDGAIDDIRLWNTARTQTQINNNKNIELTGTEAGLAAYYPFEGSGSGPASLIRQYDLNYGTAANNQSLLQSITEKGSDGTALPPTTFDYKPDVKSWNTQGVNWLTHASIDATLSMQPVVLTDVNGDGFPDIVRTFGTTWKVLFNQGTSWSSQYQTWLSNAPDDARLDRASQDVRLIDVTGDNLPDIVMSVGADAWKVWRNTGSGWSPQTELWANLSAYGNEISLNNSSNGNRTTLVDVTGDGLPDIVHTWWNGQQQWEVFRNTGSGWSSNREVWAYGSIDQLGLDAPNIRVMDVNGDGLADIVETSNNGTLATWKVWKNTGSGWSGTPETWINNADIDAYFGKHEATVADVNGDGLPDIVRGDDLGTADRWKVLLNKGDHWDTTYETWIDPSANLDLDVHNDNVHLIDVNNDGLSDIVRGSADCSCSEDTWTVWLNNGKAPELMSAVHTPQGGTINFDYKPTSTVDTTNPNLYTAQYYNNKTLSGTPVLTRQESSISYDWGNGSPDPLVPVDNFSARWTKTSQFTAGSYIFTATGDDGIRLYVDGTLLIDKWIDQGPTTYTATANLTEGNHTVVFEYYENGGGAVAKLEYNNQSVINTLSFPLWLIGKKTETNGLSNAQGTNDVTTYSYKDGFYKWQDKEFRGFKEVNTVEPNGAKKQYLFNQDDALKGTLASVLTSDTNNNPYSKTENIWSNTLTNNFFTVNLTSEKNSTYDGTATNPKITQTDYQYDNYGNITKKSDLGDTSVTGDERFTYNDYVYNPALWLVNKVAHTTLKAADDLTNVAQQWEYYDNDPSASPSASPTPAPATSFGDGSDGDLNITANTMENPVTSSVIATAGTSTAEVGYGMGLITNQIVLLHQTQGTNAGIWEFARVKSYSGTTLTLTAPLTNSYSSINGSHAQVRVVHQYRNVTVNPGVTWAPKAWDGSTGGIIAFLASGTVTISGNISADGRGFRGGNGGNNAYGTQGEGLTGAGAQSTAANGIAGGGGGSYYANGQGGAGGNSGGVIFAQGATLSVNTGGAITANGFAGNNSSPNGDSAGGGGGAGGAILIKTQNSTVGTSLLNAVGGTGGSFAGSGAYGGTGGNGRIRIEYQTSLTGSTNPAASILQTTIPLLPASVAASSANNGTLTKGDLTREIKWLSTAGATNPVTQYSYDIFGNQASVTDANNHATITTYDPTGTYLISQTNTRNQTTTMSYDLGTGNLLSKTDPNNNTTSYVYDVFGRITKEIKPYDSAGFPTTSYQYFDNPTSPQGTLVSKREISGTAGTLDAYNWVDGFGRTIQTRSEAKDPTKQNVIDTFYDPTGKVAKVTVPYTASSSATTSTPILTTKFGDGSDGDIIISSYTTEIPVDSYVTATAGTTTATVGLGLGFTPNKIILLHQTQGTNAGAWEYARVKTYSGTTLTLTAALINSYSSSGNNHAQVRVVPQYHNVTVNPGVTWTAKAWNGTSGGILAFLSSGTVVINGTIDAVGKGFRGGAGQNGGSGIQGESQSGSGSINSSANGMSGGSGIYNSNKAGGGGGGGGYATAGGNGTDANTDSNSYGFGGGTGGTADLTTMLFGGGGGGGGTRSGNNVNNYTQGRNGGGIVFISGATVSVAGQLMVNGENGVGGADDNNHGIGGQGAGGSILVKTQNATLGTNLLNSVASTNMTIDTGDGGDGGTGGIGRIRVEYETSLTGTTNPVTSTVQTQISSLPSVQTTAASGSFGAYTTPDATVRYTETTYDPLVRVTIVKNPKGNSKTTSYDHWKQTSIDENGHIKRNYYNAFDKINKVDEVNNLNTYSTTYDYDSRDLLTKITDSANNISTYTYNSLGNKTTQVDPDMGTWQYTYDGVGNLLTQKDNKNITTTKTYDELNRLTKTDYPTDTDSTFAYDLGKIGTLSIATDSAGTVNYAYDNRLRKTQEQRTIEGTTWTTQFAYDALDRLTTRTNPDLETITYNFNPQGEINSVGGILNNIDYNAQNKITKKNFANGISTNYSYNTNDFRLNNIKTVSSASSSAATLQDLSYNYDNVGNILGISDNLLTKTQTFGYDDLDRLTSASESAGFNYAYQYNPIGNLIKFINGATTIDYTYGVTAGVHALTSSTETAPVPTPTPTPVLAPNGITLRAATSGNNLSGGTTLAINKPTGTTSGNVLVANVIVRTAGNIITAPTGWALIKRQDSTASISTATYWKLAGATEPTNYTWTFGTAGEASGGIGSYTGVDNTNPIDASNAQYNSGVSTANNTGVTTTTANDMLIYAVGVTVPTTVNVATGFIQELTTTSTTSTTSETSDKIQATAGATGTISASHNGGANSNITHLIALKPAGSTPAPTAVPTPTRTPLPTYIGNGTATPVTLSVGNLVTLNASFTNTSSFTHTTRIHLEIRNPSDQQVYSRNFDNETFTSNQTKNYSTTWTIPQGSARGTYLVKGGSVSADWTTWYLWSNNLGTFTVTTATPTPTPTPVAGVIANGLYKLVNTNSNKVLDVTGAGTTDRTNVEIWTDNGGNNQKWQVTKNIDGTYKLIDSNSNKALDVNGSGITDGTNVQIWTDNGTGAQKWQITQNLDGTYKLINTNSGKALDVNGAGTAAGTNVQIWTDNGTGAQKWQFVATK